MNTEQTLCILGSTGSIGTQALEVAKHLGIKVTGICAAKNVSLLEEQIRRFTPKYCAVTDEHAAKDLKISVSDTQTKILSGADAPSELAEICPAETLLNSIIGLAGLLPTLSAIRSGKNIALANKETLVAAGELVMSEVKKAGVFLLPVDSEHCAIHQCIGSSKKSQIKRLILTASGGSFFGKTADELKNVTPEQALTHPNWHMGRKITVDSGTLVNKGLELIEAMWLFDMPEEKIDVIIHRESVIHSMVEYLDHSVMAQLAAPDMRLCIQYALCKSEKYEGLAKTLDLTEISKLTFFKPDHSVFPSINLARKAVRMGKLSPCVYNSANEACVELFLEGKISFTDIFTLISEAVDTIKIPYDKITLDDILTADLEARAFVKQKASAYNKKNFSL